MAIEVRSAIMRELDIIYNGSDALLHPIFETSGIAVNGTGRVATSRAIASILNITGTKSIKEVKDIPVRIVIHKQLLIGIGSFTEDKWCYLPSAGTLMTMNEIKESERQVKVEYM